LCQANRGGAVDDGWHLRPNHYWLHRSRDRAENAADCSEDALVGCELRGDRRTARGILCTFLLDELNLLSAADDPAQCNGMPRIGDDDVE